MNLLSTSLWIAVELLTNPICQQRIYVNVGHHAWHIGVMSIGHAWPHEGRAYVRKAKLEIEANWWIHTTVIWWWFRMLKWQWLSLMRVTSLNTFPLFPTSTQTYIETLMPPDSLSEGLVGVNGGRVAGRCVGRVSKRGEGRFRNQNTYLLLLFYSKACCHDFKLRLVYPQFLRANGDEQVDGWHVNNQKDPTGSTHHPAAMPTSSYPESVTFAYSVRQS